MPSRDNFNDAIDCLNRDGRSFAIVQFSDHDDGNDGGSFFYCQGHLENEVEDTAGALKQAIDNYLS